MKRLQVKDIIKTENIIRTQKGKTLSSVAAKLTSSHDSAFVFDEDDKYLGIINPYYCFIKTNYPAATKVENCLVHAPKIKETDSLSRAAKMMIESKIHYLPVFRDTKFIGIISARRLIEAGLNQGLYNFPISQAIRNKKPIITINTNSNLAAAWNSFKNDKISKLVVVDGDGKLKGLLSFFDLIYLVSAPKEKPGLMSRIGEKDTVLTKKIKPFYKTLVLILKPTDQLFRAADLVIKQEIGSVVVTDNQNKPISIITTKDLLRIWAGQYWPQINITKLYQNINFADKQQLEVFNRQIFNLLRQSKQTSADVIVRVKKESKSVYQMSLEIISKGKVIGYINEGGNKLYRVIGSIKQTFRRFFDQKPK